jgi:hypothetical protein
MPRYLNEIRLGKEKQVFRDIIQDVRREFDLYSSKRPVPHITLFGPYDTQQGGEVKTRTQNVLSAYRVVPFRVTGFDAFTDTNVVYANVEPSQQLRELRRELAGRLEPVTSNYRSWDTKASYEFHITIATNLNGQVSDVLRYVKREYDMEMELYATRVPALDRRRMLWEWDLPRGIELSSQRATSKQSWEKTMEALDKKREQANEPFSRDTAKNGIFDRLLRLLPW